MAVRCPACNKFASYELSDPEPDLQATVERHTDGTLTVSLSGDVRVVLVCAHDGEELAEMNFMVEGLEHVDAPEGLDPDALEEEDGVEDGELEADVNDSLSGQEDTGEKRKRLFGYTGTATVMLGGVEVHTFELHETAPSADFDSLV